MKVYFPDDPIKQEMIETLIELYDIGTGGLPAISEKYKKYKSLIERATGMTIEEVLK
jgi:hypothetical protein